MKSAMSTCRLSTCRFLMQPTKCRVRTGKLSGRSGTPPSSRGPVRSRDLGERKRPRAEGQWGASGSSPHGLPPGQEIQGPRRAARRRRAPTWSCSLDTHPSSGCCTRPGSSPPSLPAPTPDLSPRRGLSRGKGKQAEGRPPAELLPMPGSPEAPLTTLPPAWPAPHLTPPRPCLLLAATLGALGSTGVVAQHSSKAQGHPCVTAIHSHHGHLLLRWALREPCLAQQGLWTGQGWDGKEWVGATQCTGQA